MVKKRTRKHCESEDSGSDISDSALNNDEPATKKYSLRQRRRTIFTEDYEYDLDEDGPQNVPSDDEFVIEDEKVPSPKSQPEVETEPTADSEYIDSNTYIKKIEPLTSYPPENSGELIDFEDMIRADIVVNKKKIDYDKLIEGTEINVQKGIIDYESLIQKSEINQQTINQHNSKPVKVPKKRGRKPKVQKVEEEDNCHSIFQHFLEPLMESWNDDDDLPLAVMLRKETTTEMDDSVKDSSEEQDATVESTNEEQSNTQISPIESQQPDCEDKGPQEPKTNEPLPDESQTQETTEITNGHVENLCDTVSSDNFNCDENIITPNEDTSDLSFVKIAAVHSLASSEENDDVILIEAEKDIIVLDD